MFFRPTSSAIALLALIVMPLLLEAVQLLSRLF